MDRSSGILVALPLPTSLDHSPSWYICLFLVYLYPCVFPFPFVLFFSSLSRFHHCQSISIAAPLCPPPPSSPPAPPSKRTNLHLPTDISRLSHGINILIEPAVSTPPHGQTQSWDVAFSPTQTFSRISWMSAEKWPICKKRRLTSMSRRPGYLASVSAFPP